MRECQTLDRRIADTYVFAKQSDRSDSMTKDAAYQVAKVMSQNDEEEWFIVYEDGEYDVVNSEGTETFYAGAPIIAAFANGETF